ncbi:MAG: MBOAT family protein [Lachnospiraceae bacterium]|nr:MBOAT family protein [Lachnospiraceae bacterium]
MLFNSAEFLIFFPIVVLVYFIIPKKIKYLWLLAASYYFYMCWNARYALLLFFSTAVTWASGLLLERIKHGEIDEARKIPAKKAVVALSFFLNLGVLFWFKYVNFAVATLERLLRLVHIQLSLPEFDILLPVGISFFTFQALSYTMDVYRDEIYAEKNFFRYALFVSFFPQLVAGPIERSKNLLKQLADPQKFSFARFKDGILLMLWGFFLKIVLADRLALFVDTVYGDVWSYGGWYLIIATMLFGVQIYCDFYGYSVIATGAAEILGIRLMENFDAPYLSCSVAEFWRKWHISLTSWFRDYLYIPLGGSRRGKARKYRNKMIVFLISGLWHGAQSTYVVWGMLNGLYQVAGELTEPIRTRLIDACGLHRESFAHRLLRCGITFVLVDFSWIFFRASTVRRALAIVRSILTAGNPWILLDGSLYECGLDSKNFWLVLLCIAVLLLADCLKHRGICVRKVILRQDVWCQCMVVVFAIALILLFGLWGPAYSEANFIYFQF